MAFIDWYNGADLESHSWHGGGWWHEADGPQLSRARDEMNSEWAKTSSAQFVDLGMKTGPPYFIHLPPPNSANSLSSQNLMFLISRGFHPLPPVTLAVRARHLCAHLEFRFGHGLSSAFCSTRRYYSSPLSQDLWVNASKIPALAHCGQLSLPTQPACALNNLFAHKRHSRSVLTIAALWTQVTLALLWL
jgi:hypothetical protein